MKPVVDFARSADALTWFTNNRGERRVSGGTYGKNRPEPGIYESENTATEQTFAARILERGVKT